MRRSNRRLSIKRPNYTQDGSDEDQPKKSKSDPDEDEPKKSNATKKSKLLQKESNQRNSNTNELLKISPQAKANSKKKINKDEASDGSSSESDIENYLQPAGEIDLNSTFFTKLEKQSFEAIENSIFSGINRLSDSESDSEFLEEKYVKLSRPKKIKTKNPKPLPVINFQHVQDYAMKLEEAKKVVAKYEANKKIKQEMPDNNLKIENLLAVGEAKLDSSADAESQPSVHSSDYESFSESEKEDWEEVEERDLKESQENNLIPINDLQITVELPTIMRQKKGKDLVASMKRRLNKIRKENQILVHQVHVLCWIGHGNFVNKMINDESVLSLFLSLIPTEYSYKTIQSFGNLEEILKWFKSTVSNIEKRPPKDMALDRLLKLQIIRKEAFNKKMLVYMFVCLIRSLGIQCRLVLSFQVSPLKPPASELHSVSTKTADKSDIKKEVKEEEQANLNSEENEIDSDTKIKEEKHDVKIGKKIKIGKTNKQKEQANLNSEENKIESDMKIKEEKQKVKIGKKIKIKLDSVSVKSEETIVSNVKEELNESTEKENKSNSAVKKAKGSKATNLKQKNTKATKQQSLKVKSEEIKPKKRSQSTKEEKSENKESLKLITKPSTRSKSTSQLDSKKDKTSESSPLKKRKSLSLKRSNNNNVQKISQLDGVNDSDSDEEPTTSKKTKNNTKHSKRIKSLPDYAEINSDDDFKPQRPKRSTSVKSKSNSAEGTKPTRKSTAKNRKSQNQNDEDSDYTPEIAKKKKDDSDDEFHENKERIKQRGRSKKVTNSPEPKPKRGFDIWVEVYLETEEQWISVDINKGEVNCTRELHSRASHPITYVIAWHNDNSVKDITQRYCPKWNTVTRKLRATKKWWDDTIKPFEGQKTARDQKEDEELAQLQLDKPLPTTIHEYKNHPLYVLKRHLLKFEALYPPEPITLGFIRKEAVYSRDCVHRLRTREYWFKQAKVVKPGEEPYRIVKTLKWDKIRREILKDQPLEIFGVWQVDDYVPPTAQNGIVPRNEYGNVELFQTCMIPKGTVHLQLPGLNKLARRMNIDCAPAMVGFDFHSGWNHPVFDGYVVCEEHSESLIAAWYFEQDEQEKREKEKLDKRVYGNWKKLIKGLLIRERLKARYDFGVPSQTAGCKKKKCKVSKDSKKRRHCSENESDSDCD